jgi:hypothetical protein
MPHSHDSAEQQLEEIVAYLDGELSGDESARVERRLASDEDFRQQLQSVERAWTALDELPMTTVDDRFSRTTLSMVVEAAAEELRAKTRALPIARRRRWLATLFGAAAAAAFGFLVFRLAWQNPNEALLADLPVIDNVDIYSQFQDLAFLRRLHDELGDELAAFSGDADDIEQRERHFVSIADDERGEAWLRELDDEQRTNLRAKYNRFRELSEPEQNRLRELHAAVVSAPDAEQLQRTMLAYQQWLASLPPVRQFELRNILDIEERVARIERWANEMRDDELLTLTKDELTEFFRQIRPAIVELAEETRDDWRAERRGNRELIAALLGHDWWRRELDDQFELRRVRQEFYRAVLEALPERTRPSFEALGPDERVERFRTWMRQFTACQGQVTQAELEQFFAEELDPKMQAELLSLPPGEMERRLRLMYRCPNKYAAQGRWSWEPNDVEGDEADDRDGDRDRRRDGDGREGDGRDRDRFRRDDGDRPLGFGPPGFVPGGRRGFGPLPRGAGPGPEGGPRRPFGGGPIEPPPPEE